MTLADKMLQWKTLAEQIEILEAEIRAEVMDLQKSQKVGGVTASYNIGHGSYDYKNMAMRLEPDQSILNANTKVVTDWRKVCEQSGMTDDLKSKFYTPGTPSVTVKLDK